MPLTTGSYSVRLQKREDCPAKAAKLPPLLYLGEKAGAGKVLMVFVTNVLFPEVLIAAWRRAHWIDRIWNRRLPV